MFNQSISAAAMESSMGAMWQRMQIISHNIANEDTPGFKAKRLSFESELQKQLKQIQNTKGISKSQAAGQLANIKPEVYDMEDLTVRADGNNVNLDNEYIELTRVQMQYDALLTKISGHYSMLRYAVTGGR